MAFQWIDWTGVCWVQLCSVHPAIYCLLVCLFIYKRHVLILLGNAHDRKRSFVTRLVFNFAVIRLWEEICYHPCRHANSLKKGIVPACWEIKFRDQTSSYEVMVLPTGNVLGSLFLIHSISLPRCFSMPALGVTAVRILNAPLRFQTCCWRVSVPAGTRTPANVLTSTYPPASATYHSAHKHLPPPFHRPCGFRFQVYRSHSSQTWWEGPVHDAMAFVDGAFHRTEMEMFWDDLGCSCRSVQMLVTCKIWETGQLMHLNYHFNYYVNC